MSTCKALTRALETDKAKALPFLVGKQTILRKQKFQIVCSVQKQMKQGKQARTAKVGEERLLQAQRQGKYLGRSHSKCKALGGRVSGAFDEDHMVVAN